MAKTAISDMTLPANWNAYISLNSTVRTALWELGVVVNAPAVEVAKGGRTVNMPFMNDLTGSPDQLSDAASLSVNKVTSSSQIAVVHARGKAFSVNDLAAAYAGTDVLGHINGRIGDFWARGFQTQLINTLTGMFAASNMSANVLDISALSDGASVIGASSFIDAEQLLGDRRQQLTAVACHSAVVSKLEKLDLIQYVPQSQGLPLATYRGKRIIEIDSLTPVSSVYTMYLFGPGAFGFAEGADVPENAEVFRDILAGDWQISTRRSYVLHPMGVSYIGALDGHVSPSDTDLATGTNWSLSVDQKLVPVTAFKFTLS